MPTLVRDIKVALSSTGERMYTHFPQEFIILTRLEVLNLACELLKMVEDMRPPVLDKPFQSKVE